MREARDVNSGKWPWLVIKTHIRTCSICSGGAHLKTYIQICTKSLNIKYTVTLTSHWSRTNNHCTETHVCTTLSFRVTIRLVTLLYTIYAILVTYFLCVLFVRYCCIFIMTRERTLPYFWRYEHISIRTRAHHNPNEQTPPHPHNTRRTRPSCIRPWTSWRATRSCL